MGKNTAKKFAIGAAVAAAVGYLAGILTAPKSGKETRQDIKDTTQKGVGEAEKQLKQLYTELTDMIDQAKAKGSDLSAKTREQLDGLVDKAKESKDKARELLSAVHEGEADDKDLQRAINDASKAIEHLRDYLSK